MWEDVGAQTQVSEAGGILAVTQALSSLQADP